MRHRAKPWGDAEMAQSPCFINNPTEHLGRWQNLFASASPIHLEIGCGKGGFIVQSALARPDINFIGLEKEEQILVMALRLAKEHELPTNLLFTCADANWLADCFDQNELERVYLNFSDPWRSRGKWRKRRLTHGLFLNTYETIMKHPCIHFKTDDRRLFHFSIAQFELAGWQLSAVTDDLHNSPYAIGNIQTEYEQRFMGLGKPICRLEATKEK